MAPSKENKMAETPMGKLVLTMSLPLMISMLVQAFYNVVDSLFVSHIPSTVLIQNAGDKAVQALTLAFPIQMLMIACNTGTGVGINAVLSRYLGRRDREKASFVAGNALFLAACIYLIFMLFGLFGTKAFFLTQTSDPVTLDYGISYLRICTTCAFGNMGFFAFEKILQATGNTTLSMAAQLSGAVTNILLDPVFIFGYFGLPAMGVAGAAVATVIGQCVSMTVGCIVHYHLNHEVDNGLRYVRPNRKIIGEIYKVGVPAIAMQSLTSVMAYGMNLILGSVSEIYVTAFGIYYKLQNFIFMPAYGLNNALVPITGFSYGARRKDRIAQSLRFGLLDVSVIMAAGILAILLFAPAIVSIFAVSPEIQDICVYALRIICLGYLFSGANIVLQGFYQALGNGIYSLIVSLLRMTVVLMPLAWILAAVLHLPDLVWIAFPIAEFAAFLAALVMLKVIYRKRVRPLEEIRRPIP